MDSTSVLPKMDLSDLKELANIIAKTVSDQVVGEIEGFHYKVAAGIVGALVSALVYMYLTQRADQKNAEKEKIDAYNKLFAVIAESTKTMETVKNGLKTSTESQKDVKGSVEKLQRIVRGCKGRDTTNDDEID